MAKNILLHGATNCNSTNYGDYIYTDMIYTHLTKQGHNVRLYQASDYFKKHLKKYADSFAIGKEDMLIFIPGGYFGENQNAKLKENIIHFLRFMPIGIKAAIKKKKIIVLAIGAGPARNLMIRYGVKKICNHAEFVTTRDSESYSFLKNMCPKANIINTGDLIITSKIHTNNTRQIRKIINKKGNKKLFLIHYNHEQEALKKYINSINAFNEYTRNYYYVIITDSINANDRENRQQVQSIAKFKYTFFNYDSVEELSKLISISDVVLTSKLHVGVVATMFGKSVISVACHYDKTHRYYDQIGQSKRCIDLYQSSEEQIESLIKTFYNKKTTIPQNLVKQSTLTWQILNKYLKKYDETRKK